MNNKFSQKQKVYPSSMLNKVSNNIFYSRYGLSYQQSTISLIVRGLVPYGVQGGHQLPASHRRSGRRPGQGAAGGVHDEQHDGHSGGLGQTGPQVRPHVREEGLRPLVRR